MLASFLSPDSTSSLKAPILPPKPLRTILALDGKAYMAASQASACLHTVGILPLPLETQSTQSLRGFRRLKK